MAAKQAVILTHGGAGSKNEYNDGTEAACQKGLQAIAEEGSALDGVCRAVVALENDSRFNAGIGSRRRADGSIQMDAACMDSSNRFGAVAVVEGFQNPVLIARTLMDEPYHFLAGEGAEQFAHERKFTVLDESLIPEDDDSKSSDTVGAVAFDGKTFAAALSTGGTGKSWPGRVGDVPLIGCGLYAGPDGAIAATGHGESIVLNMTAYRAYEMLEAGRTAEEVVENVLGWFEADQDIGLLVVGLKDHAGGSNRSMAQSAFAF